MRRHLWLIAFAGAATAVFATEPLPQPEPDDSFEIEPPLLIPNRDTEPLSSSQAAATTPAPAPDVEKLEKDLHRAERNAAGADHLYKIGVIAKADAENRVLRVVRLRAELAKAQLAMTKDELAQAQSSQTEASSEQLHNAESSLARAIESAHAAETERERAELAAAETNLERQRKLLALGSGRKSEVAKAEEKLAQLKTPKEE
jgi:hypothetical protein